MQDMMMLPRHAALGTVVDRLTAFRVVVLTGARQVGKSTLARMVLERVPGEYFTLDDLSGQLPNLREEVRRLFVSSSNS